MKSKGGAVMSKHKEISQPLQPSKINSNNSKISRKGKNPTRHRNATKSKAFVNSTTTRSALSLGKRKRSGDDDDECDQGLLHASKVMGISVRSVSDVETDGSLEVDDHYSEAEEEEKAPDNTGAAVKPIELGKSVEEDANDDRVYDSDSKASLQEREEYEGDAKEEMDFKPDRRLKKADESRASGSKLSNRESLWEELELKAASSSNFYLSVPDSSFAEHQTLHLRWTAKTCSMSMYLLALAFDDVSLVFFCLTQCGSLKRAATVVNIIPKLIETAKKHFSKLVMQYHGRLLEHGLSKNIFPVSCFNDKAIKTFIYSVYCQKRRRQKKRSKMLADSSNSNDFGADSLNRHKLLNAVGRYSFSKYGLTQFKSQSRLYLRERIIKGLFMLEPFPGTLAQPLLSERQIEAVIKKFVSVAKALIDSSEGKTTSEISTLFCDSVREIVGFLDTAPYSPSLEDVRFSPGLRGKANIGIQKCLMPRNTMGKTKWEACLLSVLKSLPCGALFVENVEVKQQLLHSPENQSSFAVTYLIGTLIVMDCNSWSAYSTDDSESQWMNTAAMCAAVATFLQFDLLCYDNLSEAERLAIEEKDAADKVPDIFESSKCDPEIVEFAKTFLKR